ncbi:hypothetical protein EG856_00975 [Mycoplasmopsis phocirhinis]|uniref:Uncharacterized protein n=1 Tax=Mycoplasmopsis phocirhinis TaxID=142650 RepID=A0A4P6MRP3_9BACT|nr:hypothetical protein [Mycoplasmopsis phocirhinis]QBF34501.1 hypothetical protein EG856_00975 [Mycoplasmopsis phocirhinis]
MSEFLINVKISLENININIIKNDGQNFISVYRLINKYVNLSDIENSLKNVLVFIKNHKNLRKAFLKWSLIWSNSILNISVKNKCYEHNFDQKNVLNIDLYEHIISTISKSKVQLFKSNITSYLVEIDQNIKEYDVFPLDKSGEKLIVKYNEYLINKNQDFYDDIVKLFAKNQINNYQNFIDWECYAKIQNLQKDALIVELSIDQQLKIIEYQNSYLYKTTYEHNIWDQIYNTLTNKCTHSWLNINNIKFYIDAIINNFDLIKNIDLSLNSLNMYKIIFRTINLSIKNIIVNKQLLQHKQIILKGNCSKILKYILEQHQFNNVDLFSDKESDKLNISDVDLSVISLVNDFKQQDLAQTQNLYQKKQTKKINIFNKISTFFNKNYGG